MHLELTAADHEKNGFVSVARSPRMTEVQARAIITAIDAEISDEMEPDNKTASFTFILDLWNDGDLLDTGKRLLPTQIAMRLAPKQVQTWLDERPEPDDVMFNHVPVVFTIAALKGGNDET